MDCGHIPLSSYAELISRVRRGSKKNLPLFGSFELTSRCNLNCVHCYINERIDNSAVKASELTTDEIFSIVDQLEEMGCISLILTGGECLVRDDFLEIYTYTKKKGILVSVYTNGTLITKEIIDHWIRYRPKIIEITIYGATEKTYEAITGVRGSFDLFCKGVERLHASGVHCELKAMVLKSNQHELAAIKELALRYSTFFRFDPVLSMRIDNGKKPLTQRIPVDDLIKHECSEPRRVKEWKELGKRFVKPPENTQRLYKCGAGINFFHIDAYGSMSTCMAARKPGYDLRKGTVLDAWEKFIPEVLRQEWVTDSPCQKCEICIFCGQCPGMSQMEHGDQEKMVDYLCEIGHRRAEAFGFASHAPFMDRYRR
jgi:radical SAM protein with 4Fe4S-binding SPASM domain